MQVAIIGTGQVGVALADCLGRAGHQIKFGARSLGADSVAEAARAADAVILAMPFSAAADVVAAGGGFAGKVVIDATNPVGMGEGGLGLSLGFNTSGAEQIAALAPQALVFKTFNQTGFENMAHAGGFAVRPVMFVAGDSEAAKPTVMQLVTDTGFEAIDAGPLRNARLLEPLAMLWIDLALKRGQGRAFAFAVQRQP